VEWIDMLRNPAVSPSGTMTNLHVLVEAVGGGGLFDLVSGLLVAASFAWMCWKVEDFEFLFGMALMGGLKINVHAYVWDNDLLLLSFVLITNSWVRVSLFVLL